MKTQTPSVLLPTLKLILVFPVIILTLITFPSCAARKKAAITQSEVAPPPPPPPPPQRPVPGQKEGDAYVVVEEMPKFPGGDEALLKFIGENTRYPKEAKDKNITGKVIIRFMVKEDGTVSDASVIKSVDPLLDNESIRVAGTLPKFTPGKQAGVAVPVWYMIPITFTLKGDSPTRPSRFEVIGNDTIYSYAQENPQFPGGNAALLKFKTDNINYPPEIKSLGIEGMVIVRFIIEKNGSISGIKIERGVSPSLDEEAIRVTRLMPVWQPARENGKPVKIWHGTVYAFMVTPPTQPVFKEGVPFVVVEEMPQFPGGDSVLLAYINQNTKYPENAKAKGIQGRVILRFCITAEGGIDRVSVLKGVDPELDAEAIRVVKTLPTFKPGKQGGKPVPVWYMVPITFALSNSSSAATTTPSSQAPTGTPRQLMPGYDEAPVFPGGEPAIYKFINSNLVYPISAKEKKISGKVFVAYSINANGLVDEVTVGKGIDPELDAEAVRVVRLLPAWKPGKLSGTSVKVLYSMPVIFTLE